MTKKNAAAGAAGNADKVEAAQETFKLTRPISSDGDGDPIDTLTMVEPELRHVAAAERKYPRNASAQSAHLIAALASISEDQARQLLFQDVQVIERWLLSIERKACFADDPPAPGEFVRTFALSVPVPTDKLPLAEVTLKAPDLGASIAVEDVKGKSEADRVAALIAYLAGVTIPIVMRMKRRDIKRLEGWLSPLAAPEASE